MHPKIDLSFLPKGTKIADTIIFVGLAGCLQCTYLFPLVEFAKKKHLATNVLTELIQTKDEYITYTDRLIKKLNIHENIIPIPIPFIYIEINGMAHITNQYTIEECTSLIRNNLAEEDEFSYLDCEYIDPTILMNFLTKIITDTAF